jgi:hypothetical protein
VGVAPGTPLPRVSKQLRAYGTVTHDLSRLRVLVVDAPSVRGVKAIDGVRWVEWLGSRRRTVAFTPNDPLAPRQWYLQQDHAFDLWPDVPGYIPVKVAIVDSGIDAGHPEFAGRILAARSFVGGSASDVQGHGTFVAGEIGAALNNGQGIAGIAFPAELLVGKVVRADGSVSLEGEAQAIRWAVDQGARVINLSLGGLRDPRHPERDTYSELEAAAVAYAVAHGVLVVAAVGNSDQAPMSPWPYASYPAALPHVVGVSAFGHDGSVPAFSDRDAIFNDLSAPGEDIYSTLPRSLTRENPTCPNQGYSDCGPDDYRGAEGTSFAAPQVTAAAALLFGQDAELTADQVALLLERTADDANASNGCTHCALLRDPLSGWGRLNIAQALGVLAQGSPPAADARETNDDAGPQAARISGVRGKFAATIDYWDDPTDVYALQIPAGQRISVSLTGTRGTQLQLSLFGPGTRTVAGRSALRSRVAHAAKLGAKQRLAYKRSRGGVYYVEVKIGAPGGGPYTLSWSKT